MSFGSNSGNASALKSLNGFNCLSSNSPKFNHQPSKNRSVLTFKRSKVFQIFPPPPLATNSSKCRRTGVIFLRLIGERRQAFGECEGGAQKKNASHISTVPIKLISEYDMTIEYLSIKAQRIMFYVRLIPNKPTVKDRQRKCIADVFTSTQRSKLRIRIELTLKKNNNNNCKQWDGINVIYEIYPPKVADALGLQNLPVYAFENTKITVKIYLRSNISPSHRFRSHRSIHFFGENVVST